MSGYAVELAGVGFDYQGARMSFDLAVMPGERLAIIGPSGAGKSTLLDLVGGFLRPLSGRISIMGLDVAGLPPSERPASFIFQENNVFAHLSAEQNVGLGISPRLRLNQAERSRVSRALAEVGLAGFEKRMPGEMSGGERQRVALARAFLRARPLLLLDEPFAALGPALRADMLRLLRELQESRPSDRRMTILLVTHHPEDALGFAHRTAFVHEGRIADCGPTEAILSSTANLQLNAYLGVRPPA